MDGNSYGMNPDGDSQVEPQDVSQELHENEPIVVAPRLNPMHDR